jgi:hypothetical protein
MVGDQILKWGGTHDEQAIALSIVMELPSPAFTFTVARIFSVLEYDEKNSPYAPCTHPGVLMDFAEQCHTPLMTLFERLVGRDRLAPMRTSPKSFYFVSFIGISLADLQQMLMGDYTTEFYTFNQLVNMMNCIDDPEDLAPDYAKFLLTSGLMRQCRTHGKQWLATLRSTWCGDHDHLDNLDHILFRSSIAFLFFLFLLYTHHPFHPL